MFSKIKTKALVALGGLSAVAANAAPAWADTSATGAFDEVLAYAAPIAIAVVVGVAGVRVVIKLINRGAGK